MCEILLPYGGSTLNNSPSKASKSGDVSPDSDKQKSSSSEETPIENYGVKGTKHYPESSSRSRIHHHRHHHHSKSLKKKDTAFSSNADRYQRTAAVLRCSGLLKISQSISQLLRNNETLQTEIDELQQITREHSKQLQKQMREKLEKESKTSGVCNEEGQRLLTLLSQVLL